MNDPTPPAYDGTIERTADGGVIRFERRLDAPIREVWDAITSPERLARLAPCLAGRPVAWGWDDFAATQAQYALIGLAPTVSES